MVFITMWIPHKNGELCVFSPKNKGSIAPLIFIIVSIQSVYNINRICLSNSYNSVISVGGSFIINQHIIIVFGLIKISVNGILRIDFLLIISQYVVIVCKALLYE